MYTIQALWTMARENLDVYAIIFTHLAHSVRNMELERVGTGPAGGPKARSQLELTGAELDFTHLSRGMGVPGERVTTAGAFCKAFERALETPGPHLIEAVVPESLGGTKRKVLPWLLRSLPNLPPRLQQLLTRLTAPYRPAGFSR